ncbi:hypothetical protein HMPREF3293_02340 [Christensenella minuta]|uniref:Uncharacterized protein n=1 Tax=Christensenella minuta TaxID=626937 RepID=A0A136Q330_9FIRM|nr:hypothetical protein HMPREF3293_02340 [Christensenella minuta]
MQKYDIRRPLETSKYRTPVNNNKSHRPCRRTGNAQYPRIPAGL